MILEVVLILILGGLAAGGKYYLDLRVDALRRELQGHCDHLGLQADAHYSDLSNLILGIPIPRIVEVPAPPPKVEVSLHPEDLSKRNLRAVQSIAHKLDSECRVRFMNSAQTDAYGEVVIHPRARSVEMSFQDRRFVCAGQDEHDVWLYRELHR